MFLDLEKLIDFELFQELFNALAENGEYKYSENGLNISAKSSDGSLSLQMSYEEPTAKDEAKDFQNFVKEIDDDLFIDVCESLGQDDLTRIHNCLSSDNVETVRAGILKFKQELKKVITDKINYYQGCLNNLLK